MSTTFANPYGLLLLACPGCDKSGSLVFGDITIKPNSVHIQCHCHLCGERGDLHVSSQGSLGACIRWSIIDGHVRASARAAAYRTLKRIERSRALARARA